MRNPQFSHVWQKQSFISKCAVSAYNFSRRPSELILCSSCYIVRQKHNKGDRHYRIKQLIVLSINDFIDDSV